MTHDPGEDFSSFDYYHALFDNPKKNSVLLLDDEGIILQVNRAFLLSFGYEERDLIGEYFGLLFTVEDREKDLPMREVRTVVEEGQSFDNNYLVNRSGSLTWASGESVLLTNAQGRKCILKVIQNIHVQKESERSIIRLNNFNENILASIADAVLVLDPELKLVKANRAFLELFSLAETHLHLADLRELLHGMDREEEVYAAVVAMGTRPTPVPGPLHVELTDGHGRRRCFDVSLALLDHSERDNVLLIFHDITIQKDQERQREDILNFVAHELRNPLTNIMLNIEWLSGLINERNLGELGEFVDRTKRNAERLKKLVNELYKSTKIISGNYELQSEAFDLDGLIGECIQTMEQAHPTFTIVRKGVEGVQLSADKDKIMQVLINYLSNAIKYSGGSTYIEVVTGVLDDRVIVAVVDKGKGVPKSELPYVFNRFYRAEKTRSLEGLGVGLFLSRQIVEAHRGSTWVESEEGDGSRFYFSLPI
ncbi:MAG TPA: ATP-binding protein [Puia sp.]|nr:ATP-binding protein [Puia sp.]